MVLKRLLSAGVLKSLLGSLDNQVLRYFKQTATWLRALT
jgi:hypothetical protein